MLVGLRSRRQIAPFTLHRPATAQQALALHCGKAAFMAGGGDLIDWLKYGHEIEHLIRLDGIPGLADIAETPGGLRIGAMATHAALADSDVIRKQLPDLAAHWQTIANPRVRFTGTIGGNVMAGKSEYDGLPALLALGGEGECTTASGFRRMPLDRLQGLVTAFLIPDPITQRLFTDRTLRPALTVWLGLSVVQRTVRALRLAVGMAYPQPCCITLQPNIPLAELPGQAAMLAQQATECLPEPASDPRASAAYRRRMITILTRRLLIRAGGTA